MPTILTKKSDTPGAIPATANLTNAAGGAELAVNTADKRLFTINSSSAVVELGTNPSSLTCADASFTVARIGSLTISSLSLSNATFGSATITNLTSTSATITNLLATSLTVSSGSTLNGGVVINEPGADVDFRIEGDTDANLFFVDASTDRIGIGISSPSEKVHLFGSATATSPRILIQSHDTASATAGLLLYGRDASNVNKVCEIATSNDDLIFKTNNATVATLDQSGNLGLGVTPSAWGSIFNAMQLGDGGFIAGRSDVATQFQLGCNGYYDGSNFKYIVTGTAARYYMDTGAHYWESAASGTAGNTITFTQAMTLDASSNLMVGDTTANGRLTVKRSTDGVIGYFDGSTTQFKISVASSTINLDAQNGNAVMAFQTNGSERARITSGGTLCVNATAQTGYAEKLLATQSGGGATGTAVTFRATASDFAYYIQANVATRSANSAYEFLRCVSDDISGDAEFVLRGDGNGYADGTWNNNGADYAEYFESATGGALTVGATVVLDGNKVREATASDPTSAIMGVVRPKEPGKASMIVGNTAWNKWANKYLTDDFDRYIMEDHDVVEWTDADGKAHSYESQNIPDGVTVPADAVRKTHDEKGNKFQHYKLNPAWDKDAEYTPREKRDEWIIVGLVGQVKVLKGKPVNDRWIKMRDVSATVEEWMIR